MKTLKIILLAVVCILVIVGVFVLYFIKFPDKAISLSYINWLLGNNAVDITETSVFEPEEYVKNPDLGVVRGSGTMNEVATEFSNAHHSGVVEEDPIKIPSRFRVRAVEGDILTVTDAISGEEKVVVLSCLSEETALFSNLNINFVSAGFDARKEIQINDLLFAECSADECASLGPQCVIVRDPK